MISSIPTYIFIDDNGIQKAYRDNVVRSEMEVGPQKTRPKQSTRLFQMSLNVSICVDKEGDFNEWFTEDIGSGAYWFLMNDPLNGVRRRFRFVETEFAWTKSGNLLRSQFILEAYDELQ